MKICKVEGCEGDVKARGFCNKHYTRWMKYGQTELPPKIIKNCMVEGCDKEVHGKGYCNKHYERFKKYGNPLKRTIYDPNDVRVINDVVYMDIYDRNGNVIYETKFNKRHLELIQKFKWCSSEKSNGVYILSASTNLYLARLITNCKKGFVADHIDGDTLNNLDNNLRVCTQLQNMMNSKQREDCKSGCTGVYWDNRSSKWIVEIKANKKKIYVGSFNVLEHAIESRKQAEIKYFGEFSRQYGGLIDEKDMDK